MVEALENDEDVVQSDKTLSASPYGRQQYSNSWPVMNNYVDPNLIIKKLISPYGLQGKLYIKHNFPQDVLIVFAKFELETVLMAKTCNFDSNITDFNSGDLKKTQKIIKCQIFLEAKLKAYSWCVFKVPN